MTTLLTTGIIYAITFLISYLALKLFGKKKLHEVKYPPCLVRFPIIGSLPVMPMFGQMYKYFFEKSKIFGNVIAFYMCNQYAIILNGREVIQEALMKQSQAFSDRPRLYLNYLHNPDNKGIIMHPFDDHFKKFHRLSLNVLKSLGFGQNLMEVRIRIEVDQLLDRIKLRNGEEFHPDMDITLSVSNVICNIIFGRRWHLDDESFKERVNLVRTLFRQLEKPTTINFFPIVRFLPKYRRAIKNQKFIYDSMKENILKIMKDVDNDVTSDCFYSNFKKEVINELENGQISEMDDNQIYMTIRDLFVAGTDTTATTLQWFIIAMANHQDVQKSVQNEIDSVVGNKRHPSLDDKVNLPLFEATLLEVMRYKTLTPLALPHLTSKDTILNGMHIPSGTLVFPSIFSCHMDPQVWHKPDEFNIDRFLDDSKTKVINKDLVVPFSLGKRSCLGEILARQELFLFASALVHEFEICPPIGEEMIDATEVTAITNTPSPFKARFIDRLA